MTIHMIWAEARDHVIGAEGGIPWRIPGEQATFKQRTMGATVVMGRGTWESLPGRVRPLPGRRNVVLTRAGVEGVETAASVDEVLTKHDDFWVIGGGAVYAAFLPYANHVVRTEVDLEVPGDTFAPALDGWPASPGEWQITDTGVRWRVVEHVRAEAPRNG
ncbi:dihydrofolate reductase [Actinoplanes sp. NPDC089786]|uniref:dihydrofolate reductase n=1 Tax=Actinoplanes sp. NPDC089786 TaxID=3155185 RepID=UPI00343768B9